METLEREDDGLRDSSQKVTEMKIYRQQLDEQFKPEHKSIHSQSSSGKGKEKEACWQSEKAPDPEPDLKSNSESNEEIEILFRGSDSSNRVDLFASNFSFTPDGGLVIVLQKALPENPDMQPRISMLAYKYEELCYRAQYMDAHGAQFVKRVRISRQEAIDLVPRLRLQLPAGHEYLKDFELLAAKGGGSCEDAEHNLDLALTRGLLLPQILILWKRSPINIIEYTEENGWVLNEQYTQLFHKARCDYCRINPLARRRLRDFCEGAGPSNFELYAKRLFESEIAYKKTDIQRFGRKYIIHSCFAYLFEEPSDSLPDPEMQTRRRSSRSERFKAFVMDKLRKRSIVFHREEKRKDKDEKEDNQKEKDENPGRRRSIIEKLMVIIPRRKSKGEQDKKSPAAERASVSSGDNGGVAIESPKEFSPVEGEDKGRDAGQGQMTCGGEFLKNTPSSPWSKFRFDSLMVH